MWQIYFQSNLNLFSAGSSVQMLIQGRIICNTFRPWSNPWSNETLAGYFHSSFRILIQSEIKLAANAARLIFSRCVPNSSDILYQKGVWYTYRWWLFTQQIDIFRSSIWQRPQPLMVEIEKFQCSTCSDIWLHSKKWCVVPNRYSYVQLFK